MPVVFALCRIVHTGRVALPSRWPRKLKYETFLPLSPKKTFPQNLHLNFRPYIDKSCENDISLKQNPRLQNRWTYYWWVEILENLDHVKTTRLVVARFGVRIDGFDIRLLIDVEPVWNLEDLNVMNKRL
jgi:hypothetical protein